MEQLTDTERRMRGLEDKELQSIVAMNKDGYTDQAVRDAEAELKRRSLPVLTADEYLSQFPGERITETGFCVACVEQTTEESAGDQNFSYVIPFLLGVGTRLSGDDDPCRACHSIVQSKTRWIFVPVRRLGRYRVIWPEGRGGVEFAGGKFLSRRTRTSSS